MATDQIREELHDFINQADERMLRLIYGMMKADLEEEQYKLTDTHHQILEERLNDHTNNPNAGSDWGDVKSRIQKKK